MEHDRGDQSISDHIREQIVREFPDFVFVDEITQVDHRFINELDEERELFSVLSGRKWSDIPGSFLEQNPDGFVLLTDSAFAAFLPAWLRFSLSNDTVREFLIYTFSPHEQTSAQWAEAMRSRLGSLTTAQKSVLLEVLKLHSEMEPAGSIKEYAQSAVDYLSGFIEEN